MNQYLYKHFLKFSKNYPGIEDIEVDFLCNINIQNSNKVLKLKKISKS